jgi:hypothetical protein
MATDPTATLPSTDAAVGAALKAAEASVSSEASAVKATASADVTQAEGKVTTFLKSYGLPLAAVAGAIAGYLLRRLV